MAIEKSSNPLLHNEVLLYPLVIFHTAIENGPVEIVNVPIKHGDFP